MPKVGVKLVLDEPPTREEIKIPTMRLKVGKSPAIDCIPAEVYQCFEESVLIRFRICSPTDGRKVLYRRTLGMQSLSLCTKTREKHQTVQTIEAAPYFPSQTENVGWRLDE